MLISARSSARRSTEFRAIGAKFRVSGISTFLQYRRYCFLAIYIEFNILAMRGQRIRLGRLRWDPILRRISKWEPR
jgi:hypothetical protein